MARLAWFVPRAAPLVLAAFLFACSDDSVAPLSPEGSDTPSFNGALTPAGTPTGSLLIQFKNAAIPAGFEADVAKAGGRITASYPELGLVSVSGVRKRQRATLTSRIDVERSADDRMLQWIPTAEAMLGAPIAIAAGTPTPGPATDQSGAFFYDIYQWNIRNINADDAWLVSNQGAGQTVCVLDSGVDPGQLDMVGKVDLAQSASFVPTEPFIEDLHFHGTAMAGLIASRGIGIASVAPDARICAVKVLAGNGNGAFEWLIAGLHYAAHTDASVINMSLGVHIPASFLVDPGLRDLYLILLDAVVHAHSHGKLVVASAGNDAINLDIDPFDHLHIPSQILGVLSVGANGPKNQRNFDRFAASYSNYGITGMHLLAPGGDYFGDLRDAIVVPCSRYVCGADGFYAWATGTSQAAAHVSGAAAVLAGDGISSPLAMAACLKRTAVNTNPRYNGPNPKMGAGRLDVLAALSC